MFINIYFKKYQFNITMRNWTYCTDVLELRGMRTAPTGGMTRSNTGGMREETTRLSLESGFRSVTPSILKTQHNKNLLSTTSGSLQNLTSGMRPFAPRSPGDINIEDVVKFSRQGGKLSQDGKHDGKFEGNRYFRCKPNKGVFVAFNKVVMAWSPI
ncbi:hypothetical protein KUTeg_006721 [Tegillarca granosa]|uniref:CAP-Gly domain-containing protein n=1 Tax=Tegillarca granosa TaxID=220873 RepID=A0ABQ9FB71_TEGGR|nr:hypothetical protein KUTeg_006721 [Tegillarca granosa]